LFDGGAVDMGKAYVFLGSGSGLTTGPSWQMVGASQASAKFGWSVAGAGDVNRDGFGDVIVGAHLYDSDGGVADMGKAYVFLGSTTGLTTGSAWQMLGANAVNGMFGISVSRAGDVNGDGFGDVVVGEDGFSGTGKAYVFLGSSTGLTTSPVWQVLGS